MHSTAPHPPNIISQLVAIDAMNKRLAVAEFNRSIRKANNHGHTFNPQTRRCDCGITEAEYHLGFKPLSEAEPQVCPLFAER